MTPGATPVGALQRWPLRALSSSFHPQFYSKGSKVTPAPRSPQSLVPPRIAGRCGSARGTLATPALYPAPFSIGGGHGEIGGIFAALPFLQNPPARRFYCRVGTLPPASPLLRPLGAGSGLTRGLLSVVLRLVYLFPLQQIDPPGTRAVVLAAGLAGPGCSRYCWSGGFYRPIPPGTSVFFG